MTGPGFSLGLCFGLMLAAVAVVAGTVYGVSPAAAQEETTTTLEATTTTSESATTTTEVPTTTSTVPVGATPTECFQAGVEGAAPPDYDLPSCVTSWSSGRQVHAGAAAEAERDEWFRMPLLFAVAVVVFLLAARLVGSWRRG